MESDGEEHVRMVMLDINGHDQIDSEALANTPDRVIRSHRELYAGYRCDPAKILSRTFNVPYNEMIVVSGIPLYSMCEHHMLPFVGVAHVGYIPNGKLLGISKIARLVDCFARRLQLQERLTAQVADSMMEHLEPRGVGVIIKAEHTCMTMRGVNKPGTKTITAAMRGLFLDDDKTRAEFLELIELGGGE